MPQKKPTNANTEKPTSATEEKLTATYVYGYDPESHRAFRIVSKPGESRRKHLPKEWADLSAPENFKPTDNAIATFLDGAVYTVLWLGPRAVTVKAF